MKKYAIVTTTKVCRRTRSAISPSGTARTAATAAASSSSTNTASPVTCQARAAIPTV